MPFAYTALNTSYPNFINSNMPTDSALLIKSLPTIDQELFEIYKKIGEHLRHNNRFSLPKELQKIIQEFVDWHVKRKTKIITPGTRFFRARINAVGQKNAFEISDMCAPPKGQPGSGRINPEGISYLYLADKPETALAEVRPWRGAYVTIAEFEVIHPASVVSVLPKEYTNLKGLGIESNDDLRLLIRGVINSEMISNIYFATPAHGSDKLSYLPSQYIAESLKANGADGIEYASVLNPGGVNTALFNSDSARGLSANLYQVRSVSYEFGEISVGN